MRLFCNALVVFSMVAGALFGQEMPMQAGEVLKHAQELIAAHQMEKANELLTELVRNDPSDEAALIELGKIQVAQGLNVDALKSFEAVLSIHPASTAAREGEVQAARAEALADHQAGIDGVALLYLIRARKFVPDSPELLLDFGLQANSMRIFKDADTALTKAHELDPKDLKILYALARVEFEEQKMPDAEAHLRAYLQARPEDATAHYGLGRLLHMLARDDEAKVELERSIALQPRQTASYYELGEVALEQDQDSEAKRDYEKVLELAPRHGGALTGMGILAFRAKDYPTAEKYLQSAILNAPDYSTAHRYYALVLARTGRLVESKRESDIANSLNQKEILNSRGNFLTVLQ
jgi:tetratricopeptide (TPR) repeat protein